MATETTAAPERKSKVPWKSILVLVGIMMLEGGVFALWMTFADPKSASGAGNPDVPTQVVNASAEVKVLEFQAFNRKTGRTYRYDISVCVECAKQDQKTVEVRRDERRALIQDEFRTLVAKADPQHLQEPDLETLRRQFKATLDEVLGEGLVKRVLIPSCCPYPVDF